MVAVAFGPAAGGLKGAVNDAGTSTFFVGCAVALAIEAEAVPVLLTSVLGAVLVAADFTAGDSGRDDGASAFGAV